jgi:hypothetical protein
MIGLASRFLGFARRTWAAVRAAIWALLPCRFAIVVLFVVTAALTLADQGLETLRVMAEFGNASQVGAREPYLVRLLLFFLGTVTLASSAWYFSRQALLLEPPRKPVSILPDRGAAMESAWDEAWGKVADGTFSRPFLELEPAEQPARLSRHPHHPHGETAPGRRDPE